MSPIDDWKAQARRAPAEESRFEEWVMLAVAGVIFGDKAGELLILKYGKFRVEVARQVEILEARAHSVGLSCVVLCGSENRARVVMYRRSSVAAILTEVPHWVFREMGYATDVDPETFLEEVGRRWSEGAMPDEIGFALGYPIKDVLGFMGLIRLPCTGACGWRIFGDPNPSLRASRRYKRARERVAAELSA
jgi:hypothetical protein